MARDLELDPLTDEERERLLEAAAVDEREGRLVRCSTPTEVRQFMATFFRHEAVTWDIDYTTQAREDLIGLDPELMDAITNTLITWLAYGPPRQHERVLAGIRFYEAAVADKSSLATR